MLAVQIPEVRKIRVKIVGMGGRGRPVSVPSMPSVPISCRVMAISGY